MLKILRHKKNAKKIWIVLAVLIVPAFVLWGSGSLIRNQEEEGFAGRMFGKNVTLQAFKDAYKAEQINAVMQYGDKLSESEQQINYEAQAWERLLLLYEAKRRNLRAQDKEVVQFLQNLPFFQREGVFDKRLYEQTVQYVFGALPREFEEITRQNIILSKLYRQVTQDVAVEDPEVKAEYEKAFEEFSVEYIAALPADFAKEVNASEENVRGYFDKNPLSFKQPVSFNMEYLIIESQEKLEQVAQRLNKKEDFQKVAQEMGLAVKETGLFAQTDPIPGIGWSAEMLSLISRLQVGQFTPPIRMDKNFYLMKLKERIETYIPEFEKVKDKAREMYIKDESAKIAQGKAQECLKRLREGSPENAANAEFGKIAKEFGLKSDSTASFKYSSYIEGIGTADALWLAAKSLKEGSVSDALATPSGFYIIKIKARIPVDEKKFESEKAEFSQKILAQKKLMAFAKFADELKRKAL